MSRRLTPGQRARSGPTIQARRPAPQSHGRQTAHSSTPRTPSTYFRRRPTSSRPGPLRPPAGTGGPRAAGSLHPAASTEGHAASSSRGQREWAAGRRDGTRGAHRRDYDSAGASRRREAVAAALAHAPAARAPAARRRAAREERQRSARARRGSPGSRSAPALPGSSSSASGLAACARQPT
jgi:hypothetical protein